MTTRENIEIDYCPECRGVWLDRGELDKLIERSSSERSRPRDEERPRSDNDERYERRDDHRYEERHHDSDHKYDDHGQGHHKKKKEGFMGDLFDF